MYRIALVPGDGIGREVIPEAARLLESTGLDFEFNPVEVGYDVFKTHGVSVPKKPRHWGEKTRESINHMVIRITQSPINIKQQPLDACNINTLWLFLIHFPHRISERICLTKSSDGAMIHKVRSPSIRKAEKPCEPSQAGRSVIWASDSPQRRSEYWINASTNSSASTLVSQTESKMKMISSVASFL